MMTFEQVRDEFYPWIPGTKVMHLTEDAFRDFDEWRWENQGFFDPWVFRWMHEELAKEGYQNFIMFGVWFCTP